MLETKEIIYCDNIMIKIIKAGIFISKLCALMNPAKLDQGHLLNT